MAGGKNLVFHGLACQHGLSILISRGLEIEAYGDLPEFFNVGAEANGGKVPVYIYELQIDALSS